MCQSATLPMYASLRTTLDSPPALNYQPLTRYFCRHWGVTSSCLWLRTTSRSFLRPQLFTVMALSLCVQDCFYQVRLMHDNVTVFCRHKQLANTLLPFYPNTDLHDSLHKVREAVSPGLLSVTKQVKGDMQHGLPAPEKSLPELHYHFRAQTQQGWFSAGPDAELGAIISISFFQWVPLLLRPSHTQKAAAPWPTDWVQPNGLDTCKFFCRVLALPFIPIRYVRINEEDTFTTFCWSHNCWGVHQYWHG